MRGCAFRAHCHGGRWLRNVAAEHGSALPVQRQPQPTGRDPSRSRNAHAPSPPSPDNRDPSQVEPSHARLLSPTAQPCVQGQGERDRETPTHHHPNPDNRDPSPGRAEPCSAALPNPPTMCPRAGCTGSRNAHPPSPQPRQSQPIPGRAEPRSAALPLRPTHGPHGHTTKVPAPPRRAFLPARRSRARSTRPSSVAPAGRGGAAGRTRYRVPGTATTSPAASAAQTAALRS